MGVSAKVMVVDEHRLAVPLDIGVFEGAAQLLFPGIDPGVVLKELPSSSPRIDLGVQYHFLLAVQLDLITPLYHSQTFEIKRFL